MSNRSSAPPLSPEPELLDRLCRLKDGRRKLIAIAGPPASGKSSLAHALRNCLKQRGINAETIPMDGFHLDNRLLDMRGLRARKGSHETFDVQGFISLIMRLKHDEDVIYPIFDRARDLAIAGAGNVSQSVDFVLVEGNYLLFDHPDWSALAELWDFSIWIETPLDVIRDRCIARWLAHDHTPEEARVRTESNDLANARRLLSSRLSADIDLADHSEHAEKHERHL